MLGTAWSLLGAFRLHCLLPRNRIDPTAKYSVRMKGLESMAGKTEDELEVCKRAEELFTGNHKNQRTDELLRLTNLLREKALQMKEKVRVRPAESQFESLYNELHQFGSTLASKEKLVGLIKGLSQSHNKDNYSILSQEALFQVHFT